MAIIYKILFEVQLMHEYYLTNYDGKNIFENNAVNRQEFLKNKLRDSQKAITDDVYFSVPALAQKVFDDYHLKLLTTYSGFKVAIEVKKVALAAGRIGYEPLVSLPDRLNIPILINRRNHFIDGFTNRAMSRTINTAFYFSNNNLPKPKKAPFLTNEITDYEAAANYEQGNIARFAADDVRIFYKDILGVNRWLAIPPGNYMNENDCLLVEPSFYYTFLASDNVQQATFTLKDNYNTVIQTVYAKGNTDVLKKVSLNFSDSQIRTLPEAELSNNMIYNLEITGSNGYNKNQSLIFLNDEGDFRNVFGMVNINPVVSNPEFKLTDAQGLIITKRNADNSILVNHPIFEIWIKSRFSFWRYVNDRGLALKNDIHTDYLTFDNGRLVSKEPRTHSYTPTLYRKPVNITYYLPNPVLHKESIAENKRLYTEIMVTESALFPLGP